MGVAGGELLIPTIVLLFAVDIKIAGSLTLAISLPTMRVAFAGYSRDISFAILRANKGFVLAMATGSIIGTILGGLLLGAVPSRADPPAGRASPPVCDQGLASQVRRYGREDNDRKGPASRRVGCRCGRRADTIHTYEKTGLLAPARTPGGLPAYEASAVERPEWCSSRG